MGAHNIKPHKDSTVAICLDTIQKNKQSLVFCSSKRGAESQAEKISKAHKQTNAKLEELSSKILLTLSNPTKQCKRLAACVKNGCAFHHAGLHSKQRELLEDAFRESTIHTICSTPTLAAGLDLPAFRAIIRDYKRFGQRGMAPIPVLEYLQMAGRAGRPGKEDFGEALLIANKEEDIELLSEQYINGEVEDIYSKLAVEPVLRTYILSLVSTEIITTTQELFDFFDTTFYAHQFGDVQQLHLLLRRMVRLLEEWEFITISGTQLSKEKKDPLFSSGMALLKKKKEQVRSDELKATDIGRRIAQLYIDPMTAYMLIQGLKKLHANAQPTHDHVQVQKIIHVLCCSLEMRPLLSSKPSDIENIFLFKEEHNLLMNETDFYEYSQDEFDNTIKTTFFFSDWIQEASEETLLEKYNIRPGEITYKQNNADWLLYACEELARIKKYQPIIKILKHVRLRIKHGIKSELVALLQFKGIGRVRARMLFRNNITGVIDVKKAPIEKLVELVGPSLAISMKEEAGVAVDPAMAAAIKKELNSKAKKKDQKKFYKQTQLGGFL